MAMHRLLQRLGESQVGSHLKQMPHLALTRKGNSIRAMGHEIAHQLLQGSDVFGQLPFVEAEFIELRTALAHRHRERFVALAVMYQGHPATGQFQIGHRFEKLRRGKGRPRLHLGR